MAFIYSGPPFCLGTVQRQRQARERVRQKRLFSRRAGAKRGFRTPGLLYDIQAAAASDLGTSASSLAPDAKTRECIRIAVPSKGDIHKETLELLKSCGLEVDLRNPRQYMGGIRHFPDVELWFQRPADIVRKVKDGTLDIGVAGYDLVAEYNGTSSDVVIVHDRLGFGICRLGLGVPILWTDIQNIDDFRRFAESRPQPLRIVTKFPNQSERFLQSASIQNYRLLYQDGALEAATQLGTADCIIDLISSGVTLRENNLKEIEGGTILDSEMQLIGNRFRLTADPEQFSFVRRLRDFVRELIERMDAHFTAQEHFNVIANIRGESAGDVARRLGEFTDLRGLDGPTISTVIPPRGVAHGMYAIGLVVKKTQIYSAMKQLRRVGGSGVCVLPVTFVFEGATDRWQRLCRDLNIPIDEDEWRTPSRS